MSDHHGNNLFLAFIHFEHSKYKAAYDNGYAPLTQDKIQQFVDKGFDINFQNKKTKNTLLIDMITMGNPSSGHKDYVTVDLIEWLINNHKPDLNLKNNQGYTALLTSYWDYHIMALLLKHGASLSLPNKILKHVIGIVP